VGGFIDTHGKGEGRGKLIQSNLLGTDSEGAIKSLRINGVSVLSGFRINQGQSKLFVIMRCPYYKRVSVKRGLIALACSSISSLEIVERVYGNKNRGGNY